VDESWTNHQARIPLFLTTSSYKKWDVDTMLDLHGYRAHLEATANGPAASHVNEVGRFNDLLDADFVATIVDNALCEQPETIPSKVSNSDETSLEGATSNPVHILVPMLAIALLLAVAFFVKRGRSDNSFSKKLDKSHVQSEPDTEPTHYYPHPHSHSHNTKCSAIDHCLDHWYGNNLLLDHLKSLDN
jgi:hypothetical protein